METVTHIETTDSPGPSPEPAKPTQPAPTAPAPADEPVDPDKPAQYS